MMGWAFRPGREGQKLPVAAASTNPEYAIPVLVNRCDFIVTQARGILGVVLIMGELI